MWRSISTVTKLIGGFGAFLESETYQSLLRREPELASNAEPCVLDIVQYWFTFGEGTTLCPRFDTFLVAMMAMTTEWIESGQTEIDGMPLWPDPKTGEPRVVRHFLSPAYDPDEHLGAVHPVLVRDNFEIQRERDVYLQSVTNQRDQVRRIIAKIDSTSN